MKLYEKYVEPKLVESIKNGVSSSSVCFDECMNPNLFNECNMKNLKCFIEQTLHVDGSMIKCSLSKRETIIGNKHTLFMCW